MTTTLPQDLDYTAVDQELLEERLARLLPLLYPEWTDTDRAQFGNTLVRINAFVGGRIAFLLDNYARESRWTTASLRLTLLSFAQMLGYRPRTSQAATVTEVFSIPSALPGDVVIPAGRRVLTAEVTRPIAYQLLSDLTIPAGQTSVAAVVENSSSKEEFAAATSLGDQAFRLDGAPYIDGTMQVVAGQGTFAPIESLLEASSAALRFEVEVDDRDRPVVRFGDGVNGAIPFGTIRFNYRVGGGRAGRVEAGALSRLEGAYTDTQGNVARVSVTNPTASAGGTDRETNAEIKRNGPRAVRTHRVLVERSDYEFAAERVPGVARALHLPDSLGPNQGWVYVVTDDLSAPTPDLIAAVEAQWGPTSEYKKLNTYQVFAQAAPLKVIDVTAIVYLASNTTPAVARTRIEQALQALFALNVPDPVTGEIVRNSRINFGYYTSQALAWSDAFNAVRDAAGVAKVDAANGLALNGLRDDVLLTRQQFPKLGNVELVNGLTGEPF